MTIWKFPFDRNGEQLLDMPVDAEPLTVGLQNGVPTLWCRCSPDASVVPHKMVICPTGGQCNTTGRCLGTLFDGSFVWHVFWEGVVD